MTAEQALGVILAAGGIVWRDRGGAREYLLIHRHRHRDWTLPKGKRDPGETLEAVALREVREESGWDVRLQEFAGACGYDVKGRPKLVAYWMMEAVAESGVPDKGEVDKVAWLPAAEALARLDYELERSIFRTAVRGSK